MNDKVDIRQLDEFTKMIDCLIDHYDTVLNIDIDGIAKIKAEISQAKNIILTAKDDVLKIKQDLSDVGDLAELAKDLKQKEQTIDELILKINLNSVIDDKTASSVAAYSSNKVNELLENMKQSLQNLIPKNTITTDDDGKIDISLLPNLNKSDVGLSNVDDTADINKPISEAMQEALNAKLDITAIATDIQPGITKLKNSISGNAIDTAVTENAVKNYVDESLKEWINQSYQDVTNERNIDIVYTNTTNKAIFIILTLSNQRSGIVRASVFINDMLAGGMGADSGNAFSMSFLIPPNATYKVTQESLNGYSVASNLRVVKWLELR